MKTLITLMLTIGLYLVLFTTTGAKAPEIVYRDKPTKSLDELLKEIPPKYGIPHEVMRVLVQLESGGRMNAVRFEPHLIPRVRKYSKDTSEQRQLASSHCALQVLGLHMPPLGMQWSDLYDPETCVEVASKIFANGWERHKDKPTTERYYLAFKYYNGSDAYARKAMSLLGKILIEKNLGKV